MCSPRCTSEAIWVPWGQWIMRAAPGTFTLRAEAGSQENLKRLQDLLTTRLEKIGGRDHLTVNWQAAETPGEERPAH
jgi:hypothetical protein